MVFKVETQEFDGLYRIVVKGRGSTGKMGKEVVQDVAPENMGTAIEKAIQTLEGRLEPAP